MVKKYYIIEPLDIDGDKNPDGFLISQYKIDKNNNKIFLKNKYVTYSKLNTYIKKGGLSSRKSKKQSNNKLIVFTPEQFNEFMNNKLYNKHKKYSQPQPQPQPQLQPQHQLQHQLQPQPQLQNNPYYPQYQNQPPPVIIRDNNSGSFGNALTTGLGVGIGASAGASLFDSIFGE